MQSKTPLILSVIIVSYNTADLTIKAINSVIKDSENSPLINDLVEIFVVDNNSQDETVTKVKDLQKSCKYLHLIKNNKNLGFAQANNQAIQKSKGKYIFLLNSDAQVLPSALAQLVKTFESNPIDNSTAQLTSHKGTLDRLGILAASLYNPDKTYQPQGGDLPTLFSITTTLFLLDDIFLIGKFLPAVQETGRSPKAFLIDSDQPQQKGWVGGTAMCLRKELINEIGLFDKNIFMYGEDVEFCLRAKNHHWDIAIDPLAKAVHVGSASSTNKNAILGEIKTFLYIWKKHKPTWQLYFVKMILYFAIKFRIIVFSIIKDTDRKQIYKEAKNLIK